MCTVTWLRREDGFELLCNRDELRTRGSALPPAVHRAEGIDYLCPIDSDAGGTWIAVNQVGLALCLLNDYRAAGPERPGGWVSRGILVRSLAAVAGRHEAEARLADLDLSCYRPFHLLLLGPGLPATVLGWNGSTRRQRPGEPRQPLSSSSFDPDGAERHRRAELESRLSAGGADQASSLVAYHRSHAPARGPYSPCMHRPDAASVSFSRVSVGPERITFAYADGPPCRTPVSEPQVLARRAAGRPIPT